MLMKCVLLSLFLPSLFQEILHRHSIKLSVEEGGQKNSKEMPREGLRQQHYPPGASTGPTTGDHYLSSEQKGANLPPPKPPTVKRPPGQWRMAGTGPWRWCGQAAPRAGPVLLTDAAARQQGGPMSDILTSQNLMDQKGKKLT